MFCRNCGESCNQCSYIRRLKYVSLVNTILSKCNTYFVSEIFSAFLWPRLKYFRKFISRNIRYVPDRVTHRSIVNLFWRCKTKLYEITKPSTKKPWVLDSHRYKNEDFCLLGCDSLQVGRYQLSERISCLHVHSLWKNGKKIVLKCLKWATTRL